MFFKIADNLKKYIKLHLIISYILLLAAFFLINFSLITLETDIGNEYSNYFAQLPKSQELAQKKEKIFIDIARQDMQNIFSNRNFSLLYTEIALYEQQKKATVKIKTQDSINARINYIKTILANYKYGKDIGRIVFVTTSKSKNTGYQLDCHTWQFNALEQNDINDMNLKDYNGAYIEVNYSGYSIFIHNKRAILSSYSNALSSIINNSDIFASQNKSFASKVKKIVEDKIVTIEWLLMLLILVLIVHVTFFLRREIKAKDEYDSKLSILQHEIKTNARQIVAKTQLCIESIGKGNLSNASLLAIYVYMLEYFKQKGQTTVYDAKTDRTAIMLPDDLTARKEDLIKFFTNTTNPSPIHKAITDLIEFKLDLNFTPCSINAFYEELSSIVFRLLSNTIKHTSPELLGKIKLGIRPSEKRSFEIYINNEIYYNDETIENIRLAMKNDDYYRRALRYFFKRPSQKRFKNAYFYCKKLNTIQRTAKVNMSDIRKVKGILLDMGLKLRFMVKNDIGSNRTYVQLLINKD